MTRPLHNNSQTSQTILKRMEIFIIGIVRESHIWSLSTQGSCAHCTPFAKPTIPSLMDLASPISQVNIQTGCCQTDMLNDIVNTSIKRNDKTFRPGLLLVGGGSPPEIWLPKAPQMQVHRLEIANCSLRNTNYNMQIWTMCPDFQCLLPSLSSPTFGLTLNVVDQQVDFSHTPFFS